MAKRTQPTDGLGPREISKIRSAVRQVWHRCKARQLVVKRCTGSDGYFYCELCFAKAPKIQIDHIVTVGELDGGFIERMFCPSSGLRGLCVSCHRERTKEERKQGKEAKKNKAPGGKIPPSP